MMSFLSKNRFKKGIWKIIVVVNNYFLLFLLTKKAQKEYIENDIIGNRATKDTFFKSQKMRKKGI